MSKVLITEDMDQYAGLSQRISSLKIGRPALFFLILTVVINFISAALSLMVWAMLLQGLILALIVYLFVKFSMDIKQMTQVMEANYTYYKEQSNESN